MKVLGKKLLLGLLYGLLCLPIASNAYTSRAARLANKAAQKYNTARLMGRGKRTVTPLPEWRPGLDTVTRKPIPGYKPKPQPAGPKLIEGKITTPAEYVDMKQGADGVWRQVPRGSYRSWAGAGAAGAAAAGAGYYLYNRETEDIAQAPGAGTESGVGAQYDAGSSVESEPVSTGVSTGAEISIAEPTSRRISEYTGGLSTLQDLKVQRAALRAELAAEHNPAMRDELQGQIKTLDNSIRRLDLSELRIKPGSWTASARNIVRDTSTSLGDTGSTIKARLSQLGATASDWWNTPVASQGEASASMPAQDERVAAANRHFNNALQAVREDLKNPDLTEDQRAALQDKQSELESLMRWVDRDERQREENARFDEKVRQEYEQELGRSISLNESKALYKTRLRKDIERELEEHFPGENLDKHLSTFRRRLHSERNEWETPITRAELLAYAIDMHMKGRHDYQVSEMLSAEREAQKAAAEIVVKEEKATEETQEKPYVDPEERKDLEYREAELKENLAGTALEGAEQIAVEPQMITRADITRLEEEAQAALDNMLAAAQAKKKAGFYGTDTTAHDNFERASAEYNAIKAELKAAREQSGIYLSEQQEEERDAAATEREKREMERIQAEQKERERKAGLTEIQKREEKIADLEARLAVLEAKQKEESMSGYIKLTNNERSELREYPSLIKGYRQMNEDARLQEQKEAERRANTIGARLGRLLAPAPTKLELLAEEEDAAFKQMVAAQEEYDAEIRRQQIARPGAKIDRTTPEFKKALINLNRATEANNKAFSAYSQERILQEQAEKAREANTIKARFKAWRNSK